MVTIRMHGNRLQRYNERVNFQEKYNQHVKLSGGGVGGEKVNVGSHYLQ